MTGRHWLVDGSNVVGSRPDGWWRDRPAAFARVKVVHAPSADDRLVELAAADARASSLTVATSDRELGERVRRLGATVIGSGSFRRLLLDEEIPA